MLRLMKLENRIVLDGAAVAGVLDHAADHDADAFADAAEHENIVEAEHTADTEHVAGAAALLSDSGSEPINIILVSNDLPDFQKIIDSADPGSQVIVYNASIETPDQVINKVTQISTIFGKPIGSISVMSHGETGGFYLGNTLVTAENVNTYADTWAALNAAMSENGRIYIFGCNTADSPAGQTLINTLSTATGADVFGSSNVTGSGGDWNLETGSQDSDAVSPVLPVDTQELSDYSQTLQEYETPYFGGSTEHVSPEDIYTGYPVMIYVDKDIPNPQYLYVLNFETDAPEHQNATPASVWIPDNSPMAEPKEGYQAYQVLVMHDPSIPEPNFFHQPGDKAVAHFWLTPKDNPATIIDQQYVSVIIGARNDAPVLHNEGEMKMSETLMNNADPDGDTVAAILATSIANSGNAITDVDGPLEGIAVIGLTDTVNNIKMGEWQYSLDGGTTWNPLGTVSEGNARLLLADTDNRIRFLPAANIEQQVNADAKVTLTIRAWDGSRGVDGGVSIAGLPSLLRPVPEDQDVLIDGVNDTYRYVSINTETIELTLTHPNKPPTATGQCVTTPEDTAVNITLIGDDPDILTGDSITFTIIDQPDHGIPTGTGPNLVYTPNLDYNGKDNPNNCDDDQFTFRVTDEFGLTADAVVTIEITPVNDKPVINLSASPICYIENSPAMALDNGITITDVDDTNLTQAVIKFQNWNSGDILHFTNTAKITGNWNAGTMTLTGTATIAEYQAAIRSITFESTGDDPVQGERRMTITVTDANAENASNGPQTNLTAESLPFVDAMNDAPTLGPDTGTLKYKQGDGIKIIDSTFTLADIDDDNMTGATVKITNYKSSEDVLSLTTTVAGITDSWDAAAGTLTLSGTASEAAYQQALRAVAYQNTSATPNDEDRIVQFTVTDANSRGLGSQDCGVTRQLGGFMSATVNRTIDINSPPDIPPPDDELCYAENSGNVPLYPNFDFSDEDSANMIGAEIKIASGYIAGEDILGFNNTTKITGNLDANSGTLTLSGTATVAEYKAAIRSVTWGNTKGDTPTEGYRGVTFTVTDEEGAKSNQIAWQVLVDAVNDAPVISPSIGSVQYSEGSGVKVIDPALTITDVDDINMTGAAVRIENYNPNEDSLSFTPGTGITGSFDPTTGTLALTGHAPLADYQTVLRTVTYINTNQEPGAVTKSIVFSVSDNNSEGVGTAICDALGPGGPGGVLAGIIRYPVNITPVNDAPIVTPTYGVLCYEEGYPAIPVDSSITITDADDTNLTGAVVQITGYLPNEDVFQFNYTGPIQITWNGSTATLTGTASIAEYQTALRSLTYFNSAGDDPTQGNRTVNYTVTDSGDATGIIATSYAGSRTIFVDAIDDAPTIAQTEIDHMLEYRAGENGINIGVDLSSLQDADDENMSKATIQITQNYQKDSDIIKFTESGNLKGSWDAETGTLTITGTSTEAQYLAALQSVTFENMSNQATDGPRTITITVWDDNSRGLGDGESPCTPRDVGPLPVSISATRIVDVSVLKLDLNTGELCYPENEPPMSLAGGLTITNRTDTDILKGATIKFTENYHSAEDIMFFNNTDKIAGTWDQNTGTLTLTGDATIAEYQAAMRSVTYFNHEESSNNIANEDPTEGDENGTPLIRKVTFTVTDAKNLTATDTMQVYVDAIDDAPVLSNIGSTLFYQDGSVILAENIKIADSDDTIMTGAKVQIQDNYQQGEDVLRFTNTPDIQGTWNAATGTLTLTGTATAAQYEAALRSISYENTSGSPTAGLRTLNFSVLDNNSDGWGDQYCGIGTPKREGTGPLWANVAPRDVEIVTPNHPEIIEPPPSYPEEPLGPIPRPPIGEPEGFELGAIRIPQVGDTGMFYRARATRGIGPGGIDIYDCCTLEEALRIGCRFAPTVNPDAWLGSVKWSDLVDAGWESDGLYLDEEFDLYRRLFMHQPEGFNVDAESGGGELARSFGSGGAVQEAADALRIRNEEWDIFSQLSMENETFNSIGPGELKQDFFRGREHLDKPARWTTKGNIQDC